MLSQLSLVAALCARLLATPDDAKLPEYLQNRSRRNATVQIATGNCGNLQRAWRSAASRLINLGLTCEASL